MIKRLILFTAIACTLAACSDDGETPQSTVDNKEWDIDGNMDTSLRPGDNFFMYCNGTWWNNTDLGGKSIIGLIHTETTDIVNERLENLTDPSIKQFLTDQTNIDRTTASAEAAINDILNTVTPKDITREEAVKAMAKSIALGYTTPVDIKPQPFNGTMRLLLTSNIKAADADAAVSVTRGKRGFSFSTATPRARQARRLLTRLAANATETPSMHASAEQRRQFAESLRPLGEMRTRTTGYSLIDRLIAELGLTEQDIIINEKTMKVFQTLENAPTEEITASLESTIALDAAMTSSAALENYNNATDSRMTVSLYARDIKNRFMGYRYSYAYATQYVAPERKEEIKDLCEQLRSTFKERMKSLDWMSNTTRENALEKLDYMHFNVGYPDRWLSEGLPTLTGNSLVEDVLLLRKARYDLTRKLNGQNAQDASFHWIISYNVDGYLSDLTVINAFYEPTNNSINIYPAFMLEPLYSSSYSDARNYATFYVVGHEITHGFDDEGANYDKTGCLRNWWTVADKMEFKARQAKLINCFNMLEIMPDELPGVYDDGEKTLGENIADLGGLIMAHQAYCRKLDRDGYTGEGKTKQEKRFFQAYANLWRSKYTPGYAKILLETDTHSLPKERVNGTVMNVDRWYGLYGVEWGDMLYLKPDQRTRIW